MAEIIGFTASLITLAGVGAKLADTLRNVVNTLRSAEHEAGLIAADISIFACSLTQLSKIISNREVPEAKRLHEIIDVLIPACSALIDELKKLIGDPMDFRMKHPLWMRALGLRFRWLVQGSKVAFIKSLMESFKLTLVFLVSTMDLAVVIHQDAQYEIRESLKMQVQTSLRFAEDAKANLLRFKEPQKRDESLALTDGPNSQEIHPNSPSNTVVLLNSSSQSLVPYEEYESNESDDATLYRASSEEEVCEEVCLLDCPHELSGILTVQEEVLKMAEGLLTITPQPTWSWTSSGTTKNSEQGARIPNSQRNDLPRTEKVNPVSTERDSQLPDSIQQAQRQDPISDSRRFVESGAFATGTDPMQYLDKQEEPRHQNPNEAKGDVPDLETMIKKILEKTLLSLKSETPVETATEPTQHHIAEEAVHSPFRKIVTPETPSGTGLQDGSERLSKLERIMLAERDELIRREALAEAERKAEKARADADKLAKLEKLILAQKEEQLKREAAIEASRQAEKAEKDAKMAKEAAEKQAAAEAAAKLLEAAKAAREEAEAKAYKEAEESKAAHEKALAEAKAAADELEKAKIAAEKEAEKLKPKQSSPIRFKDAVGRKFSFPWSLCKSWKGMEELIKHAFIGVDALAPHVMEGHYDLIGPDGEIILPQVWETVVEPDSVITMKMWPVGEQELKKNENGAKVGRLKGGFGKMFEKRPVSQDEERL